jgi:hypothetical protein
MECSNLHRLSALHDGQLSNVEAQTLRAHVGECSQCAAVLDEISNLSLSFDDLRYCSMSTVGMVRAHSAANQAADANSSRYATIRIAGMLTGLAASIAIIAAAWMFDGDARPAAAPKAAIVVAARVAVASDWERMAITLDVGPAAVDDRPILADAAVADWMVRSLNR